VTDRGLHTILCVEDEADIRTVLELALSAVGGFDVTVCAAGAEAVTVIDEVRPDLVLLDVMMPEMDGPATLSALRETDAGRTVPMVFLTAKVQQHEVERFLKLGAVGVLAKPFDPMTLPQRVRELWQTL